MSVTQHDVKCADCGAPMVLRFTEKFNRHFYGCSNWPQCQGTHGAHPDGSPMGRPATPEVKRMRMALHALCEQVWPWKNKRKRRQMYDWLAANSKSGHIGMMDADEIAGVTAKVEVLIEEAKRR